MKAFIQDNKGILIYITISLILLGICVYVKVQDPNAYKSDIEKLQQQIDSIKTILNDERQ
jgi:hypothetical protein